MAELHELRVHYTIGGEPGEYNVEYWNGKKWKLIYGCLTYKEAHELKKLGYEYLMADLRFKTRVVIITGIVSILGLILYYTIHG